jgi:hypothetical protein
VGAWDAGGAADGGAAGGFCCAKSGTAKHRAMVKNRLRMKLLGA